MASDETVDSVERIEPRLPAGCQDFDPTQVMRRKAMFERIGAVYERFGFVPLQTSEIEFDEVLTGGDPNFGGEIFTVERRSKLRKKRGAPEDDQEQEEMALALRFDLTVSLARYVAANYSLPMPFKRWQMGNVWRAEKPQRGRYRQFAQCDADIVGSDSIRADAEIITVMDAVMRELGIQQFLVRFNNRKLLNGLLDMCGVNGERVATALRIMDKMEKVGAEEVRRLLQRQPDNDFDETALALSDQAASRLMSFLEIGGMYADPRLALAEAETMLGGSSLALRGIVELREICRHLEAAGVDPANWQIDFSIARGLGYYTGPVFETTLLQLPDIGSVFSGGRFDGLVSRFSSRSLPATGASVGVDRLLAALEELGTMSAPSSLVDVYIVWFDDGYAADYYRMANELRAAGLRVEVSLSREPALRSQLGHAQSRGLPIVLMFGSNEASAGSVQLKKLVPDGRAPQRPVTVPQGELVSTVAKMLA